LFAYSALPDAKLVGVFFSVFLPKMGFQQTALAIRIEDFVHFLYQLFPFHLLSTLLTLLSMPYRVNFHTSFP
jgi:hypothetical protein